MSMTTGKVAKQFNVTTATVHNWIKEFKDYLSDDIRASKQINISQEDFIILATIHELSKEGLRYKEIHTKLSRGYRTENTDVYVLPVDLIPLEQAIDSSKIRAELDYLTAEYDRLTQLLTEEKIAHEQTRKELTSKNEELYNKIAQLERELGRAEAEARIYKDMLDKND